ncbi:DUF2933 domain-containing protein [Paracraurococcus lichenis]|uniref:DUF2933 domain-containing protein n=1 Tax=Paracraurococcus lichenis TaxID=3064888 RepID=A0ABT9EBU6_9PROT|nr:DUF2933 domain-containing protein [Paracraurococcus sp. LOR1-02]MDO9713677.1 DUF2933 domain-containing protein [Paracraurococcus sp. LOR1-02]
MSDQPRLPWWRTRGGVAALGFGLVIAFFVLREHYAHALGLLPYLLLLACPLMHLLMPHHGHGGHQHGRGQAEEGAPRRRAPGT